MSDPLAIADGKCLQFDNHISGIGVRIAIYAQNFLVFFPVLWNVRDGYISESELKSIEKQSVAILIIAFAILISTIVQAKAFTMNAYHAALVLDLSWMNNVCTFVWFMMYLHHHTKPFPTLPLTFGGWKNLIFEKLRTVRHVGASPSQEKLDAVENGAALPTKRKRGDIDPSTQPGRSRRAFQFVVKHLVLILGSLHLSLMSAVGLWLWSNPAQFGQVGTSASCGVETVILGHNISLHSPRLRIWSLIIYSILLAPGFNLLIPFAGFVIPHVLYNELLWFGNQQVRRQTPSRLDGLSSCLVCVAKSLWFMVTVPAYYVWRLKAVFRKQEPIYTRVPDETTHAGYLYISLIILFIINTVFLINIETTITVPF